MRLYLIAAHDQDLVIGYQGRLPWHIPEDLKHFKRVTMGHPILMGRGVFDEIGNKPLPGRRNVVLSSGHWPDIESYNTIDAALKGLESEDTVFLIGGGQIYRQLLHLCDRLYITEVDGVHQGDVFFPEYRHLIGESWIETSRQINDGYSFVTYDRIK